MIYSIPNLKPNFQVCKEWQRVWEAGYSQPPNPRVQNKSQKPFFHQEVSRNLRWPKRQPDSRVWNLMMQTIRSCDFKTVTSDGIRFRIHILCQHQLSTNETFAMPLNVRMDKPQNDVSYSIWVTKHILIKFNTPFTGLLSSCLLQAKLSPLQTFHLGSIAIKWL